MKHYQSPFGYEDSANNGLEFAQRTIDVTCSSFPASILAPRLPGGRMGAKAATTVRPAMVAGYFSCKSEP
jgi:hypothetical protein